MKLFRKGDLVRIPWSEEVWQVIGTSNDIEVDNKDVLKDIAWLVGGFSGAHATRHFRELAIVSPGDGTVRIFPPELGNSIKKVAET